MSNYLTEAFKKLTLLEEEVFNADAEGIEKFKAFIIAFYVSCIG